MTALLMELNGYRLAVKTWMITLDDTTEEELNRIFHSVLDGYFHLNEEHTFEEMRLLLGDGFCIEPVDEATDEDLAAQIWDHAYKVVRHGNRMGDRITDSSSGTVSPVSHA